MTEITCTYTGDGETNLVHGPTGAAIQTDLPPDNRLNAVSGKKF